MSQSDFALWVYLSRTPLLWLTLTIFVYVLFDQLLTIPWPQTLLGGWFPALKGVIPSV